MANKHMKGLLTPLVIREWQIRTTVRYYFIPMGMVKIKNSNNKVLARLKRNWNI